MADSSATKQGGDSVFVDNIFRFTQAGSGVSALLGRIPMPWVTSPRSSTMGALQERITSTRKGRSRPCRPFTCLPTTSRTRRPATFAPRRHHGARVAIADSASILPWIRSRPTSRILDPRSSARSTTPSRVGPVRAAALQGSPGHHRDPRHGRAFPDDKVTVSRARRSSASSPSRSLSPKRFTLARQREARRHGKSFRRIVNSGAGRRAGAGRLLHEGRHRKVLEAAEKMKAQVDPMAATFELSIPRPRSRCSRARWNTSRLPAAGYFGVLSRQPRRVDHGAHVGPRSRARLAGGAEEKQVSGEFFGGLEQ